MEIKYSKKKEELRRDPVKEWLIATRDFIKTKSRIFLGVAIVALFVAAFVLIFLQIRASSLSHANNAFGKAMIAYRANDLAGAIEGFKIVSDNYARSPQAIYSVYLLGQIYYQQGRYDEALAWFKEAQTTEASVDFVGGQALEMLGLCYEAKNDLAQAQIWYVKALADNRMSWRAPALRFKLALIARALKNAPDVLKYCNAITADTLAREYMQNAENLIVELNNKTN